VASHDRAEAWYADVLGLRRVDRLMVWAADGGPLTLSNADDSVHLALFERAWQAGASALALGATGAEFLRWQVHLESRGLAPRLTDHKLACSLYFTDPDDNLHEITTWDRDYVVGQLAAQRGRA
jgi:catechol 2,3-dioxygenase-like lactoylglutathione lyase family enzyme